MAPEENPGRTPLAPAAIFGDARPIWLEIGFGAGEHLAAQAAAHPEVGLVGCEPFVNGVAAALGKLGGLGNVRIHPGDARDLVELLPDGALARVFLLYPDPWPKARHARRRFAGTENLAMLARVMAAGAELRIATDIADYAEHAREAVAATPGLALAGDGGEAWEGLARDALRGEGARGGAAAGLPDGGAGGGPFLRGGQRPARPPTHPRAGRCPRACLREGRLLGTRQRRRKAARDPPANEALGPVRDGGSGEPALSGDCMDRAGAIE